MLISPFTLVARAFAHKALKRVGCRVTDPGDDLKQMDNHPRDRIKKNKNEEY
jgi:hypothetical protein